MRFSRHGGWSRRTSQGRRSTFEDKVAQELNNADISYEYEKHSIKYDVPKSTHTYTPDFVLGNGIIVETKGLFSVDDRKKHLLIKEQHPELDIRFVFQRPKNKIRKGSKTTYADWCDKNGFKWAGSLIPLKWLKEPKKKLPKCITKKGGKKKKTS